MIEVQDFQTRQAAWCLATGLKPSRVMPNRVLPWLPKWQYPRGFDHTGVYYWPLKRIHVLITEPYHSTAPAKAFLRSIGACSLVDGRPGSGLWLPGPCKPLLVGPPGITFSLQWLADNLPGTL